MTKIKQRKKRETKKNSYDLLKKTYLKNCMPVCCKKLGITVGHLYSLLKRNNIERKNNVM